MIDRALAAQRESTTVDFKRSFDIDGAADPKSSYGDVHDVTRSNNTGASVGMSTLSRTVLVSDNGNTVFQSALGCIAAGTNAVTIPPPHGSSRFTKNSDVEIGRASCRERV